MNSFLSLMKNALLAIALISSIQGIGQVKVDMRKESGVYFVPCRVNGMPLEFIFDTGASTILISGDAVKQLVSRKMITAEDVQGVEYMRVASGEVMEGIKIRLRSFDIGGIRIKDVEAVVHLNMNAPLLLGTSALERFGNVSIDYTNSLLILGTERNRILEEANQIYKLHKYIFGASVGDVESAEVSEKWRWRLATGSYTEWKGENSLTNEQFLKYRNAVDGLYLGKIYSFSATGLSSVLIYPLREGLVEGNPDMFARSLPARQGYEVYLKLDSMINKEANWLDARLCIGPSFGQCGSARFTDLVNYGTLFPESRLRVITDDFTESVKNIKGIIEDAKSQDVMGGETSMFFIKRTPISGESEHFELCLEIEENGMWNVRVLITDK